MRNIIENTLRSLFRFSQMQELPMCPEILIETEKSILKERLELLNSEQVKILVEKWPEYKKKMSENQIIEDEHLRKDLEKFLQTIN
mgnify:CR=1 FL=1